MTVFCDKLTRFVGDGGSLVGISEVVLPSEDEEEGEMLVSRPLGG